MNYFNDIGFILFEIPGFLQTFFLKQNFSIPKSKKSKKCTLP